MATTSDGDEGEFFVDQAAQIEELIQAARASDLDPEAKLMFEMTRLMLLSMNRMSNALAGLELTYAAILDHMLPELPVVPPLEGDDDD